MNNERIDDTYLKNVLKLTPNYIARHAKAMGNRTRPRAYFLDTVIAFLRAREAEIQISCRRDAVNQSYNKKQLIEDFERAKAIVEFKRKRRVGAL